MHSNYTIAAPAKWSVMNIQPSQLEVNKQSNLNWVIGTDTVTPKEGDCITIKLQNPYTDDDQTTYASFDLNNAVECSMMSRHDTVCSYVDS